MSDKYQTKAQLVEIMKSSNKKIIEYFAEEKFETIVCVGILLNTTANVMYVLHQQGMNKQTVEALLQDYCEKLTANVKASISEKGN